MGLEGSGRDLIEVLFQYLPGTKEDRENLSG
jgi:hypothetical protein